MKQYIYKVYDRTRTNWDEGIWDVSYWDYPPQDIVAVWSKEVISEPRFRQIINGGTSEMTVRLARPFTDFGEGSDVSHNNRVECYCYDDDEPNGVLIYSGKIAEYTPVYNEGEQYVDVLLLPYDTETGVKMLEDSAGNTARQYLSEDPSDILRDVLDQYRNQKSGLLEYDANTVDDTGTVVSYTFNAVMVKEALDKIVQLAPDGWYYRIDPNNKVYFKKRKPESEAADHIVKTGQEIQSLRARQDITRLANTVYFVGGTPAGSPQVYKKASRTGSISSYDEWDTKEVDLRVTVEATADLVMDKILDERDSPQLVFELEILDSNNTNGKGYDIESIRPGNTIQIKGLFEQDIDVTRWDEATWDVSYWDAQRSYTLAQPQLITAVDYSPDMVRVEATHRLPEVSKRIEDINRNLEALELAEIPIKPTT